MPRSSFTFEAIGTYWEIVTERALGEIEKQELTELIESFDQTYSRFRADSLVTQIASKAGTYIFPENAKKLFELYEMLYEITNGKVTPLVGGALEDLGYDAEYTLKPKTTIREVPEYSKVIQRQGTTITTTEPVVFDFGAAGKGYLVDLIATLLDSNNHSEYTIDASGDMLHKGKKEEIIGLEHPLKEGRVIGEVPIKNQALCGSAINRRAWGDTHHIIDPETQKPVSENIATWVLAETAMVADGLATALFFCDPEVLQKQYNYEYVRVRADNKVEYSPYFATLLY